MKADRKPEVLQDQQEHNEHACLKCTHQILGIMKAEALHRRQQEQRILDANIRSMRMAFVEARIGQCCAFLFGLFAIAAAAYCATHGAQTTGSLLGGATIFRCMSIFIHGRRNGQRKHRVSQPRLSE